MNVRQYLPLLFILCTAPAFRAQNLEIEEPVLDTLAKRHAIWNARMERDGRVPMSVTDTTALILEGKHLTGGYEEDELGRVYNFGVLDQPFIIFTGYHTESVEPAIYDRIAQEFSGELLCFLLVAAPRDLDTEIRLAAVSDTLIRIYNYDFEYQPFAERKTQQLLGLLNGHYYFFVDENRQIVKVLPEYWAYSHTSEKRRHKLLRKGAKSFLRTLKKRKKKEKRP